MPSDAPGSRLFALVAWEKCRQHEREQRQVQARSHEEAVAAVAATRTRAEGRVVYEVWPVKEPDCVLRITLEPASEIQGRPDAEDDRSALD